MVETIKIGGELESMATGGVVAAASAIKDKAKNKYQSEINKEVDDALADRYTKDEAYNKQQTDAQIEKHIVNVTTREKYKTFLATAEDVSIDTVLPATGYEDTIYRVAKWNGTEYNTSYWTEYAWIQDDETTGHYEPLAIKNMGLDITPTPGSLNPVSSDGVADTCGHLEECPEYMKVETDAEGKIMHSVSKEDGAYYYHKLKSPTLDAMMEDMQSIKEEAEAEVEQAIEDSQADLAAHYDYYNVSKHHSVRDVVNVYTANEGWEQVEYDSSLAQYDALDIYQVGETCNFGGDTEHSYEATISHRGVAPATIAQEYETRTKFTLEEAFAVLPAAVISAFAAGQKICFADLDDIIEEWQITEAGTWERISPYDIKDPEGRIEIKLDAENKIVAYRKADGTWVECVGIEAPNLGDFVDKEEGKSLIDAGFAESQSTIEDPEERLKIETDNDDKIVSYRDKDGVLHEEVGLKTNSLTLTEEGMTEFQKALKDSGFRPGGRGDWSDDEFVEIPIPKTCAIVNFGVDNQVTTKTADVETYIEFYDCAGNYFKKPIILNAQGNSSMGYWKKNQAFDLDDGSEIKFGSWVPQDSFHVKKFYIDVFRGQSIVAYKLIEQVYQTRPYGERRPWDYLNANNSTTNGIGKFKQDFDTGAMGHSDGFPIKVYFNGTFGGVYVLSLKKHRDNYYCKKDNAKQIILDGRLGLNEIFGGTIDWTAFEIRNPKSLKTVDGGKYDGDNPTEITGDANVDATSAAVKGYIERLSGALAAINADKTKAKFEEYFNVPFFIDYFLTAQVLYHMDGFWKNWIWITNDGNIWTPTLWDADSIFGMFWQGTYIVPAGEHTNRSTSPQPTVWTNTNVIIACNQHVVKLLLDLYWNEVTTRYKDLRDKGVFTTDNIVGLLNQWLDHVGYDNLKADIEEVCAYKGVAQTPSYRDGEGTYIQNPLTGGFYNSVTRVKNWLDEHLAYLDSQDIFNYNNN